MNHINSTLHALDNNTFALIQTDDPRAMQQADAGNGNALLADAQAWREGLIRIQRYVLAPTSA